MPVAAQDNGEGASSSSSSRSPLDVDVENDSHTNDLAKAQVEDNALLADYPLGESPEVL